MAPKIACKCCSQLCEGHLMVTCCVCKDKYRHACVDITANEIRILNANKGYDWTCINCRAVGKDLKDLKALIVKLQKDIQELKADRPLATNEFKYEFEDIVSEIAEREKRKTNLMLFNLPEPDRHISLAEQTESDNTAISNVLNILSPDLSSDATVKSTRLGTFSESKIRPIKIIFQDERVVKKLLINSKKLRAHNHYRNVYVSSDRTKKQLEHYKAVKQELLARTNSGETNCRIKYINGVPKVISLN